MRVLIFSFFFLISLNTQISIAQQQGDVKFNPVIKTPAYPQGNGPKVLIDEAHNNFHTHSGRYAPFARLLERDGYQVSAFTNLFSDGSLKEADILVISNALNEQNLQEWVLPTPSAFTEQEIIALKNWVEQGGSLLLIADHMPFPGAAEDLARNFGFGFNNGFAIDTAESRMQQPIIFSKSNGLLKEHAISSDIDSVASFTGQGFQIPDKASPILKFSDSVISLMPDTAWQFNESTKSISLAGWSQGAVMQVGKGKLAVFGEAAMFTAQVAGPQQVKMGMNNEVASQNYKFLLNLIHWLSPDI